MPAGPITATAGPRPSTHPLQADFWEQLGPALVDNYFLRWVGWVVGWLRVACGGPHTCMHGAWCKQQGSRTTNSSSRMAGDSCAAACVCVERGGGAKGRRVIPSPNLQSIPPPAITLRPRCGRLSPAPVPPPNAFRSLLGEAAYHTPLWGINDSHVQLGRALLAQYDTVLDLEVGWSVGWSLGRLACLMKFGDVNVLGMLCAVPP